ncbi:MAG: hypothetical protein Aurels2KO_08180 [Aureliella sp.]
MQSDDLLVTGFQGNHLRPVCPRLCSHPGGVPLLLTQLCKIADGMPATLFDGVHRQVEEIL